MSKPDTPQYPDIQPAQVVTGQDATNQAMALANQYFPQQMGAQAQGLNDLSMGNAYYDQYQPTSFEQALGNQQFQNIWPNEQAAIMQQLSNSGMVYSPVAASTVGNAYGNLATNIGEYLNTQGNTRATNNLNALLGFNPNTYYGPISNAITGQSNQQAGLTQQANVQNAGADYSNSLANYNQQMAQNGAVGSIGGGALGFAFGGPQGAAIGSNIGGMFGGSGSGGNLGNSLLASQYLGNSQPFGGMFSGMGSSSGNGAPSLANSYSGGGVSSVYGMPSGSSVSSNMMGF